MSCRIPIDIVGTYIYIERARLSIYVQHFVTDVIDVRYVTKNRQSDQMAKVNSEKFQNSQLTFAIFNSPLI